MGEVYPLDRVIKKVDRASANSQEGRLVIIDRSTGREKRSFFARDVEYLIVANTKNDRNYAENSFEHQVKDFDTDLNLGFTVNYQVRCEPGNEVRVAEALWDNTHPGAELERRIKKYMSDFFNYEDEVASIISDSSGVIKKLRQYVAEKVEREIGLNTRIKISLGQENDLANSNVRLVSPHFSVMFQDYSDPLDLKFELELSVSGSGGVILHSLQIDTLQKTVQSEIEKFLYENASAEEFLGELDTTLRQKITLHLNNVLKSWGRQVVRLSLKSEVISDSVEPLFEIDCEVSCRVEKEQVTVKNNVAMILENIGKYRVSGSPNLKTWVEQNIDSVIKSVLFNEEYANVLVKFSPIEKQIKDAMVKRAKTIGYAIQYIVSEPDIALHQVEPEPFFELDFSVSCYAQQEPITIKNHVLMIPKNVGNYIASGSPNLEKWVEQNLKSVIKSKLFDKKYFDVLVEFSPIEEEIKKAIVERAETIGYTIQHIASVPDMEPLKLTKYFSIEVKDENFETKESGVMVGLSIIVEAKIKNLNDIKDSINSQVDVKDDMQKAIERVTRSFLHTVEPERFYMRFFRELQVNNDPKLSSSRVASVGTPIEVGEFILGNSLEEEIENLIKKELENNFYATVRSITPKPLETEITRRYKELQGEICLFEFEVDPYKGGEPVKFQGNIQVEGVHENMWLIFQSRKCTLKQIKESFQDRIRVELETKSQEVLQYKESKDRNALQRLLNNWGNDHINNQFGLKIRVTNVSRKRTSKDDIEKEKYNISLDIERKQLEQSRRMISAPFEENKQRFESRQKVASKLNEATESKLDELLKKRKVLALGEGNKEEIEKIDHEIHDIENMINSSYEEEVMGTELISLENESSVSSEASFSEIAENEGL